MIRQAFRLRQRSILQQVTRSTQNISPLRISQTRTFQTTTRPLYEDSDTTFSPHSSPSLNDKVGHLHSDMAVTKSELAHLTENTNNIRSEMETTKSVMKSDMARLTGKIDNIQSEMKSDIARLIGKIDNVQSGMANLSNNLTTQMKSFIETVSAQTGVLNANFDLKLAKFENRFYFRMFWAACGLVGLGVGGTYLRYQTPTVQAPAVQTPAVQTPAVQAPAVQAPAVQTPAAQAPAVGQN